MTLFDTMTIAICLIWIGAKLDRIAVALEKLNEEISP